VITRNRQHIRSNQAGSSRDRGSILVLSLVILVAVAGFTMALVTVAVSTESTASTNTRKLTAQNLAEGAVEIGAQWVQTQWANQEAGAIEAAAVDSPSELTNESNWIATTVAGYAARYAILRVAPSLSPTPTPVSPVQLTPDGFGWYVDGNDGVRSFYYLYAIYGYAEFTPKISEGDSKSVSATVSKVVEARVTPLFQYAVFYNSDLEILPGPNMTLTGRVHSNRDMYLGSGNTLKMDTDYVRAVGRMYRKRKNDNTVTAGAVLIKNLGNMADADPSNDFKFKLPNGFVTDSKMYSKSEMASMGITTAQGFDSTFGGWDYNSNGTFNDLRDWKTWGVQAMSFWGGTVQTSDMDVPKAEPPSQDLAIDPFVPKAGGDYELIGGTYVQVPSGTGAYSKGYYHNKAGVQLRDGVVYGSTGANLSACLLAGTITTTSIWDAREGKNVPQTVIDVEKLRLSMTQTGLAGAAATALSNLKNSWNGLIYATQSNASASAPKGILLKNGSELPDNPITGAKSGLTVATNLPVYIQGDYNTKVNGISSSTNDPAFRKPAAVIGDAVNLLSNAWANTKNSSSGLPAATDTTFNTAMIAGNTDSNPSSTAYSGGLENLPRFHEDWASSNKKAIIAGSFVNLWKSKIATGTWIYGSPKYTAPNRIWDFDPNYKSYSKLPPFTPLAVSMKNVCMQ